MRYSVICKRASSDNTFYVIPMDKEDDFVDMDCDTGTYEYAPLGIMLAITKAYSDYLQKLHDEENKQFIFDTRSAELEEGVLVKVTLVNQQKNAE